MLNVQNTLRIHPWAEWMKMLHDLVSYHQWFGRTTIWSFPMEYAKASHQKIRTCVRSSPNVWLISWLMNKGKTEAFCILIKNMFLSNVKKRKSNLASWIGPRNQVAFVIMEKLVIVSEEGQAQKSRTCWVAVMESCIMNLS